MLSKALLWISAGFLVIGLFVQWIRLPLVQGPFWMSPDETANVATAESLAETGSLGYAWDGEGSFSWVHPRSFVYSTEKRMMVPVGFLGMPMVLVLAFWLLGLVGVAFFTPMLALATLYPLWKILPQSWPRAVRFGTLLVWMSFPAVILYANRGTFAQLPVTCLAVWMWWGLTRANLQSSKYKSLGFIVAGLAGGLAMTIRPIEAVWLIPLAIAAWRYRAEKVSVTAIDPGADRKLSWRAVSAFILPVCLVMSIGAYLGMLTYGSWFVSGYQIRPQEVVADASVGGLQVVTQTASVWQTLPFTIHPRNILWNFRSFYGGMFWPWTLCLVLAVILLATGRIWRKPERWPVFALGWGVLVLVCFYGNGLYQDHVLAGAVTVGNSFVRYLLPISIPIALSAGLLMAASWKHWSTKALGVCLVAVLMVAGIWTANLRDNEGLASNLLELVRYRRFRAAAMRYFQDPHAVVVSERSDKVFFPYMTAVSPMPNTEQLVRLKDSGVDIGMLLSSQNQEELAGWQSKGLPLEALFTDGNQTLYHVR